MFQIYSSLALLSPLGNVSPKFPPRNGWSCWNFEGATTDVSKCTTVKLCLQRLYDCLRRLDRYPSDAHVNGVHALLKAALA